MLDAVLCGLDSFLSFSDKRTKIPVGSTFRGGVPTSPVLGRHSRCTSKDTTSTPYSTDRNVDLVDKRKEKSSNAHAPATRTNNLSALLQLFLGVQEGRGQQNQTKSRAKQTNATTRHDLSPSLCRDEARGDASSIESPREKARRESPKREKRKREKGELELHCLQPSYFVNPSPERDTGFERSSLPTSTKNKKGLRLL